MLTLVVRRALGQGRLLLGVVALVTVGTTFLGVCALLLSVTQDRAFTEGISRSQPQDVAVDAYVVGLGDSDLVAARDEARTVVGDVLAPVGSSVTSTAVSRMRRLGDASRTDRLGYLATDDAVDRRAVLTSGRWPASGSARSGPAEAVVPDSAASRLRLTLGDQVALGREIGEDPVDRPMTVVVVGTFRPRALAGWDSDPLSGSGFDPAYSDGSVTAPAYGPFLVSDASFLVSGSTVDALRVTGHPTLATADDASLGVAVDSLADAGDLLSARLGDGVRLSRVASDLPRTLDQVRAQQSETRSTVLTVLLLGTALALTALLLAGRLLRTARDDERALLDSLGLGRRQLLVAALPETLLLTGTATLVGVPAAALAHSRLTHLPALRAAGLDQGPSVTWGLVTTVLIGALILTLALVGPAVSTAREPAHVTRVRAVAARSGVDVLLLVVAAGAWWQLRPGSTAATTSVDVARTVAPVVCVVAVTVLAVRCVPLLLALVAGLGARSRALVLPLAAHQAARRPHTGAALLLLALAACVATFGLGLRATWEQSQVDQAALRVGTDLSLTLAAPATEREAAAVAAATTEAAGDTDRSGAPVTSAVTSRPLALGRYLGAVGSPPVLVAVDTRQAGSLLRGRLDGPATWAGVGADLAPGPDLVGIPVPPEGRGVTVGGPAPAGVAVEVTPTLVLQDATGLRTAISAAPVRLDGRPRRLRWQGPVGTGTRLVAMELRLAGSRTAAPAGTRGKVDVSVAVAVPGTDEGVDRSGDDDAAWQVKVLDPQDTPARGAVIAVDRAVGGAVLRTSTQLDPSYLAYGDAELVATAFELPSELPVAVSQQLADAVGAEVDGELSATVADVTLALRVTAVVPTVPSAPGRVAVLADADTLSRALVGAGHLDPVVDAWWVARPTPGAVRALRTLDLGAVTTRTEVATQLAQGPVRVTVPAALLTLVVVAVVLLVAGAALVLGVDQRRRSAEVGLLRALGLTRRGARRLVLAEHAALLALLVVIGTLVGAMASLAVGPGLIRSDVGVAPVPDAVLAWPWAAEVALAGGLLLGCLVVAATVTSLQVGRSDTARLRTDDR